MAAFPRHLPIVLLVTLAGCITPKQYEDLPPAPLDPAPPRPIVTALPPIAERTGSRGGARATERTMQNPAVSTPRFSNPEASPMTDMIMGRMPSSSLPPMLPAPAFPAALSEMGGPKLPALVNTNAQPFLPSSARQAVQGFPPLGKEGNRETQDTQRKPSSLENAGTDMPAPPIRHIGTVVPTNLNFRQIIALQTLLDRQNFSCNCADGKLGSRSHAALRVFQKTRGLTVTGAPNAATLAALGELDTAFTSYTITADDHAQLTQNPPTWLGRSQVASLGYPTILEAVAERGHASQQAIRDLNPQVAVWPDPPAGTTLTIPDIGSSEKLPHAARIRISLGNKLIRVFDDAGDQVAQFPCSIARDPAKREPCEISVAVVAPNPNYTFDPALFSDEPESATIKNKLIIPAGPRNPVGSAWVGLSKTGYGIHGTPKPEDIGKTESHGCFRLANWNAQKLLRMVDIGTPVSVEE